MHAAGSPAAAPIRSAVLAAVFALAPALLPIAQPACAQEAPAPRLVIVGTAAFSGVYNQVGAALCRFVSIRADTHGVRCRAEQSGGSSANVAGLLAGDIQLGIVQASVLYDAIHGLGPYATLGPQSRLRMVMRLYEERVTLVARRSARIAGVADLRGKRVSIGPDGSGTRYDVPRILERAGMTLSDLAAVEALSPDEHNAALCAGRIDAYFFVVGHPNRNTRTAIETCDAELVPMEADLRGQLARGAGSFADASIPLIYRGQRGAIATVSVGAVLVATEDTPADVVTLVIRGVQDNLRDFRRLHPALEEFVDVRAFDNPVAPLHPGTLDRRPLRPEPEP